MNQSVPPPYYPQEYPPPRQGMSSGLKWTMGCGCGCLLTLLILGGLLYFGLIKAKDFGIGLLNQFTSETPENFAAPAAEPSRVEALVADFNSFGEAMNQGKDTEPLELTAEDINLLIHNHPELKEMAGKAQVEIDGDKLSAKISVPLDDMNESLKGRYLNGKASIRLFLVNGTLQGFIDDVEVNGMTLPAPFLSSLKSENIFKTANQDPKFQNSLNSLQELKIENGRLLIVPKPAADRPPPGPSASPTPPAEAPPVENQPPAEAK